MSEIVMVNVGVDDHDESLRVCVLAEDGHELVNRSVPNDPGAVFDLVISLGCPRTVAPGRWCQDGGARTVVIEACCGAADFASELIRQTEWNVQMAHPGYVNRMKQGPDKTDHGDAWLLAASWGNRRTLEAPTRARHCRRSDRRLGSPRRYTKNQSPPPLTSNRFS